MIYLEQHFDLDPATPASVDRFVELAHEALVPGTAALGGRLVGAFMGVEDWFMRVVQLTAFDDLPSYEGARRLAQDDAKLRDALQLVEELAPERQQFLREPLGPVGFHKLEEAMKRSDEEPAGVYAMAILDVRAGKMEAFTEFLTAGVDSVPIIASLRDVAGNPNRVIDLWRGDPTERGYRPNTPQLDRFFTPLRELAPREIIRRYYPLPYSPLK